MKGESELVVRLFLGNGTDLNDKAFGSISIFWAICERNIMKCRPTVRLLLERGQMPTLGQCVN